MCGRASLTKIEKELEERFGSSFYSEDLERYNPLPNYNVAPTHMHPVITGEDPKHFRYFRWGLIPFWAKDEKIGYRMINARIESILEKPSFRKPVEKRRCIVPFDGFYEWKKMEDGNKQPYRIVSKQLEIFSIAGIWERWKSPENEEIFTFSLITMPANEMMSEIHDRMPAILDGEMEKHWLDQDVPAKELIESIHGPSNEELRAYPVSKAVGNVRNNGPDLIEELDI